MVSLQKPSTNIYESTKNMQKDQLLSSLQKIVVVPKVGTPRYCTPSNPIYLGGWRGGRRLPTVASSSVEQTLVAIVMVSGEGDW